MQKKSKHSKFKNTGILFELLTRQITADILNGKEVSFAKDLLFKYFKENKELGKEWQLYNFLTNQKTDTEWKADRALSVVLSARERLNENKLREEKYNLIKEIKEKYPIEEFLKSNVNNYKVLASIYKIFEEHISKNKFDVSEVYRAKTFIIETMCSKKRVKFENSDSTIEYYKKQNEDIRLLSYKILVEKLNDKYKNLDENQKSILREYINNISNTNSLSKFVNSESVKIKSLISELSKKIDSDVTKIKINEVLNQLDTLKGVKSVKDNHIMVLLLSYELVKEINKTL